MADGAAVCPAADGAAVGVGAAVTVGAAVELETGAAVAGAETPALAEGGGCVAPAIEGDVPVVLELPQAVEIKAIAATTPTKGSCRLSNRLRIVTLQT